MRKIEDIRLFKSDEMNESIGSYFAGKKLNAAVFRIVMNLREHDFSFGDFDHLYVVFIPGDSSGMPVMSDKIDRYSPWYRQCFVPVGKDFFDRLNHSDSHEKIISIIKDILVTYFSSENFSPDKIAGCVNSAINQGEHMLYFGEKV